MDIAYMYVRTMEATDCFNWQEITPFNWIIFIYPQKLRVLGNSTDSPVFSYAEII
jgi:hypothetical protein